MRRDADIRYFVTEEIFDSDGVRTTKDGITFTTAVDEGANCSLLIYDKGGDKPVVSIEMAENKRFGTLRSVTVAGLSPDREYEYSYLVDGKPVVDIYAKSVSGRGIWGKLPSKEDVRGRILTKEYDWEGDEPLRLDWKDIVGYSTHVRGFTKHASSGVKAKGTFTGVVQKIPYLKELGVNLLQLMPVYDFSETFDPDGMRPRTMAEASSMAGRVNYWGYTKGYYFAPKASFAATDDPVCELKDMVKALHRAGIEIVLEFYFPKGIRTAYVLDCIKYWVTSYHIDGVYVNRDASPVEALAQEPILKNTKILSENFSLDRIYEGGRRVGYKNLAESNDGFMLDARRLLKGDEGRTSAFAGRARRNPEGFAVLNYMACHNGMTLFDSVAYDAKHNEANGEDNADGTEYNCSWNCGEEGPTRKRKVNALRARQLRNACLMLFLSQGTPVIYGGDEAVNSQGGNNNAWCQDNEISWINWKPPKAFSFMHDYVKEIISFRRRHPIFAQEKGLKMQDYLSCGTPDVSYHGKRAWYGDFENFSRCIGVMYAGDYAKNAEGENEPYFYVAYNLHWVEHDFALPPLSGGAVWKVVIDTGVEGLGGIYPEGEEKDIESQRSIVVPGRTIMVLEGKKCGK